MFSRFLTELRHRRVLRTAAAYALVAAAAVEFTDIVTPVLGLPDGLLRAVITIALAGLPAVLVLAWFFDLTSGAVVRGTPAPEPSLTGRSRAISMMLIGLLAVAVVYLSYRLYFETRYEPRFDRGKSIAVLPFSSILPDGESETAYFSGGIAEEILNALSNVEGLRVAARTSSLAIRNHNIKEIGETLDVSVVLEGTVRRAGDRLRISAQLVSTGDGFEIWSEAYDYDLQDVFVIQEEIAFSIVKALQLELLGDTAAQLMSPGTASTEAYYKYIEGRDLLRARTPGAAQQAKTLFEQALAFDPDYAQAYAGLADAWILLREVGNLSLLEATQKSHAAITKALQINSELPEAQASLGLCILGGGGHTGAARQFQKAIALDPDYADAYLLSANLLRDQGFLTEATRVYTQALALDPLNSAILENQALLFAYQGRFDNAGDRLAAAEQDNPGRLTGLLTAAEVTTLAGDFVKALDYARRAADIAADSPVALAALLVANAGVGELEQAQVALERMQQLAPDNEIAIAATMRFYLLTGDFEALDGLASSRIEGFLDNIGSVGPEFLFERVKWAATARLALGDHVGARELFEKGIPEPDGLGPHPANVRTLALWAQARALGDDPDGAAEIAATANRLAERARAEGWSDRVLDDALACVAAATDTAALAQGLRTECF